MKAALVTGGSKGIGRAICLKLAKNGFKVIINYNNSLEDALLTKSLIAEFDGYSEILKFDVANKTEVEEVLNNWIISNPEDNIEILVNNAGIRQDALMVFMTDEEWTNVMNTNLNGFFYVTRVIVKEMILKKYGRIINIVSLSGLKGLPGQTNYSATKAGIIGATKALAQEVARKKITVNAVAPGFITTDMTKDLNEDDFKILIPMKRFGKPEEVAEVVGFLTSKEASYITGEVISVNGGLYT